MDKATWILLVLTGCCFDFHLSACRGERGRGLQRERREREERRKRADGRKEEKGHWSIHPNFYFIIESSRHFGDMKITHGSFLNIKYVHTNIMFYFKMTASVSIFGNMTRIV